MDEFKNKMMDLCSKINVEISDTNLEKFYKFMNLLLMWNEKINLTAITEIDEIILKHFVDCMTILKYIDKEQRVVDVGTGAGFPGIPIAIMNSNVEVTLLDSLNKRIMFLDDVVDKINLKNVKTVHSRVEDFGNSKISREKYDVAVSRAVANLTTLVEYLIPTVKVGGKCICMKGPDVEQEIEEAKYAIKSFGGNIEKVEELVLPGSDIKRTIIIIKKLKDTPKKYPRKAGVPAKQPLKIK